jgi:hypothetical protein
MNISLKSGLELLMACLFCFSIQNTFGQNSADLFKIGTEITEDSPAWVKLMHSENPNVWEVERAYEAYYRAHEFEKNINTQNYKHWRKTIYSEGYITDNGFINIPDFQEHQAKKQAQVEAWQRQQSKRLAGSWTAMGPFNTFWEDDATVVKSDQVNIYTFDQAKSNANILFCGTETDAVFKSTNKGVSWTCVSDGLVVGDIRTIKIHPTNPNIVMFGTPHELYRSTNGGATWTMVYTEFNMKPNDILFIPGTLPADPYIVMVSGGAENQATQGGLYRSTNTGVTWTKMNGNPAWDLELKPGSTSTVYALQTKPASQQIQFYRSTNKGLTFTEYNTGWFAGSSTGIDNSGAGARMTVTPANPNYIYVALLGNDVSHDQDAHWIGVYKSTDGGTTWSLPAGDPGGPYSPTHYNLTSFNIFNLPPNPYHQGYYNLAIAASATNAEHIMVGCLNLFQSTDGAASYLGMGGYQNQVGYVGYRHPDVQEIEINGNDVWVANDGGIDKYSADWTTAVGKNNGINGSEYWGFDTGWNEDVLVGGRYHNGNAVLYENYPAGQSLSIGGAESATGYVNKGENRRVHVSDATDRLIPTTLTGPLSVIPNLGIYPSESNITPENAGEIEPDPRYYNHMWLTRDHQLYKSEDGGENFTLVHSFGTDPAMRATRIEISRSSPQFMYVCQRLAGSSVVWRSNNGGGAWAQIILPAGINTASGFFISLSATNHNELYLAVANGGFSNEKIYKTLNAGTTWTNLTTAALDGERPQQMMHQYGTNGGVYLATDNKVFYRNNTHADWQLFTTGTPADFNSERMRPFYKESKVRIATTNRGIWSSPLFELSLPIAQPTVNKKTITCYDEIIQFEDYSVLDHTNATWTWTITPAPAWIDNPNARNPRVRLGAVGSYNVTLAIQNGNGQMSSKTVTNMVTATSTDCFCAPCADCSSLVDKVGVATFDNTTCCVDLTPAVNWQSGGVWYSEKMNLNTNFTLDFDIDLGDIDANDADGATFTLQKQSAAASGNAGGGLGIEGVSPALSVAFRTYVFDDIGIWENGTQGDISGTPYSISGSGAHAVQIKWNATTQTLTVDWDNNGVDLTYNDDIVSNIFGGNANDIIWGFTGGTGGLNANLRVCNIQMDFMGCPINYAGGSALSGEQIFSADYETNGGLQSTQTISGGSTVVDYDSQTFVELLQGFEVQLGAIFNAFIDGCGGLLKGEEETD